MFKKGFGNDPNIRVMTDLVGNYNTVVMEMHFNNLAEFEKEMEDYKAGKMPSNLSKEVAEEMSKYSEMYMSGRREIFQILD